MINIEKLKEYEEYRGYSDGFYLQKVKSGSNLTAEDEWYQINGFIQDLKIIQKNLASPEFVKQTHEKLLDSCDDQDTINYINLLAEKF